MTVATRAGQKVFRVWESGNWAGGARWMYFETEADAPSAKTTPR
ncbi:MAG TPA: hypothetical protein VG145_13660 [Xanthobacteraceae bacterium]|jgi:hypothetical protein|nr:hypothetical protein [Xanthobacteraceae bacterium]